MLLSRRSNTGNKLENKLQKEGKKLFKQYIKKFGTGNIDALLGTFKCLERLKRNSDILDSFKELNQVFNIFYPLHIEKCKIFISCGEYENAVDYIKDKLIRLPQKHFDLFKILAVCNLVHEGDFKAAILSIEKMWEMMLKQEIKNPDLYYQTSMLFARICDRKPDILKLCEIIIDKALEFSPKNSNYLNEKAYYRLLSGDMKNAFDIYSTSAQNDVNNKDASYGLIFCKILKQQYKEAQEEIDFLKEIEIGVGNPIQSRLIYYEALVKYKKGEKEEVINSLITEALNTHVKLTKTKICNKFESLIYTNFDFLYELAKSINKS